MIKGLFFLLIITIVTTSCNKRSSDILPPAKMQAVLWDYLRADAFTTDFIAKDSALNPLLENVKLQKELFAYHHITKEIFYKSYRYYISHSKEMGPILDSLIAQKNRSRQRFIPKKFAP